MKIDTRLRVHGALLLVTILFSANYIISKVSMRQMAPLSFAWLRVVGSAALLLIIARPAWRQLTRRDLAHLAGLSMLGVVINQTLFLSGLALSNAHVAAILITTVPAFSLGEAILFGQERATRSKMAGIAFAAVGALLIIGGHSFRGDRRELLGSTMLVVNCIAYSLYLVMSKPVVQRLGVRVQVTICFVLGAFLMLPVALSSLLREEWSAVTRSGWLGLLFVILGPTVGAYLLLAIALRHAESSLVAFYTYLQPLMATILATLFLGERIRGIAVVAGILIFAGLYLAGRKAPIQPGVADTPS